VMAAAEDASRDELLVKDLFEATKMGYVQAVKALLRDVPKGRASALLSRRDSQGHTLAHWAAQAGKVELLQLLSSIGAPMFDKSDDSVGMTPLHWACWRGHPRAARALLDMGADIDSLDNAMCTPLIIASQHGNAACAALMIKMGADPSAKDANADSALHWAAYKGDMTIVGLLDHLGVAIHEDDKYGQTPLHLASLRGNMEVVEYLVLDRDVDVTVEDNEGATAQQLAVRKGKGNVAGFLRRHSQGLWKRPLREILSLNFVMELLGFNQSRSREDSKAPFYVLIFNTIWSHVVFLSCIYGDEQMYDQHMTAVICLLFMMVQWVFFILTWRSDPGTVRDVNGDLERRYEEALNDVEALANGDSKVNLCHTCHIVRPLRSKHCRVSRKCVRDFDHYCPFVQNTVGQGNYRYFFLYLVTFQIAIDAFLWLCMVKLWRDGWGWVVGLTLIYFLPFWLMNLGMCVYHAQLVYGNLTTNEHSNRWRYGYLQDAAGGFHNPYDKGFLANVVDRCCPDRQDQFDYEQPPPNFNINYADLEMGAFGSPRGGAGAGADGRASGGRGNAEALMKGTALDKAGASKRPNTDSGGEPEAEAKRPLLSA